MTTIRPTSEPAGTGAMPVHTEREDGCLQRGTNWWGAFVIGLAGVILVTGIAPFAVQSLGAASIPLFVGVTALGVLLCFCLAELAAMMPDRTGGLPSYAFETFKRTPLPAPAAGAAAGATGQPHRAPARLGFRAAQPRADADEEGPGGAARHRRCGRPVAGAGRAAGGRPGGGQPQSGQDDRTRRAPPGGARGVQHVVVAAPAQSRVRRLLEGGRPGRGCPAAAPLGGHGDRPSVRSRCPS